MVRARKTLPLHLIRGYLVLPYVVVVSSTMSESVAATATDSGAEKESKIARLSPSGILLHKCSIMVGSICHRRRERGYI
jgi:hypothetical protein